MTYIPSSLTGIHFSNVTFIYESQSAEDFVLIFSFLGYTFTSEFPCDSSSLLSYG